MPKVNLKVYPAHNGDSFLLRIGQTNLLIDGGYVNTFKDYILRDLENLTKAGEDLSYVIITHVDQDHISGILKLFEQNHDSEFVKISNVWHNSYRHFQNEKDLSASIVMTKDAALDKLKGGSYLKEINEGSERTISAIQGSSLAALLLKGAYSWNQEFEGKAVSIDNGIHFNLSDDIRLTLLSPNNEKLHKLEREWQKELRKNGYLEKLDENAYYDDAFEFMVARHKEKPRYREKEISSSIPDVSELTKTSFFEDTTAANGSSIAFVIEYQDLKLLFLGDAHPGLVVQSLRSAYAYENWPMQFDVIKTSHHGSWANNSPELLSLIDAPKYIFSTNGKGHDHPDDETIANIVSRKADYTRQLYFNYQLEKADRFDVKELREKFNYCIIQADGKTPLKIEL